MTTHDLNEKLNGSTYHKLVYISMYGVLARRIANYSYWTFKKLSKENLNNIGFTPMKFEAYPHFDGHLYQYNLNETIKPRLFHEVLGIPKEFIRSVLATRQELHDLFNAQAKHWCHND